MSVEPKWLNTLLMYLLYQDLSTAHWPMPCLDPSFKALPLVVSKKLDVSPPDMRYLVNPHICTFTTRNLQLRSIVIRTAYSQVHLPCIKTTPEKFRVELELHVKEAAQFSMFFVILNLRTF